MADYVGNKGYIQLFPNGSQRFWRYKWEITDVDYINLTSTFTWTLTFVDTVGGYAINRYESGYVTTDYGTENEQKVYWSGYIKTDGSAGEWVFKTGTHTIQHDAAGSKANMPCVFYASWNGKTTQQSPKISLDRISAQPSITNVTNAAGATTLYDDDDFVITYENPAGTQVDSLQAGIAYDRSSPMDVEYMDIPKDATTHTLQLDDTQRAALYAYYSATKSNKFYFLIKVVFQDVTYTDYISATINLRNYTPTLSPTIADNNSATLRVTGNSKTLVKYMSNAAYKINAAAKKGATITEQFVTNGATYTTPTGTISAVASNTFYFGATDSRGDVVNDIVIFNGSGDLKWVEYIKLTTNIKSIKFNTNGSLDITVTGKFFNGNFGAANNKLTINYEVHPSDSAAGSWRSLGVVTPTVDDEGSYTYSFTLSGYDYLTRYEVSIKASDELMATDAVSKQVAAVPVFDWGENDFNFNVPVNFSQGFTQPLNALKQLWNGQQQMADSSTSIDLIEPISEQANGIVLIFTPYNSSTGLANDEKLQSFFVSKKVVQVMPRKMHTFMLIDSGNFATIGAKSLYIADDRITGYANNNTSGGATDTTGSIKYDNTKFVLRYVLGV